MIAYDDREARPDVAFVHGWLTGSDWSPDIERMLVEQAIAGSHCLGAYRGDEQVGSARTITGHATSARIVDVFKVIWK